MRQDLGQQAAYTGREPKPGLRHSSPLPIFPYASAFLKNPFIFDIYLRHISADGNSRRNMFEA